MSQLDDAVAAVDIKLDEAELKMLLSGLRGYQSPSFT
jgi:hypothetical protein